MANEQRTDLISRKALIAEYDRVHIGPPGGARKLMEDAPGVDAVEVVHAQWDNNGICTLCGYPIPTDSKHDFIDGDDCLFCYHCGAKMDGGNEDGC